MNQIIKNCAEEKTEISYSDYQTNDYKKGKPSKWENVILGIAFGIMLFTVPWIAIISGTAYILWKKFHN